MPLRYDLVDVGREVLAQIATPLSMNLSEAPHATPHADPSLVAEYGDAYVEVLTDLDELVATEEAFLLGPWLQMARAVGTAEREEGDEDELADWLRHVIDEDVAEEKGEEAAAEEVLLSQAR